MASSIPSQARAVDPFASYNSDTVNTLTRMLTYGENGLATALSCDVSLDSTSNTKVVLGPGFAYQSDVWINLSSDHVVDFDDQDHYYNFDTGFDEVGYYYVVLEYTYVKSRPAPEAKALIVKPSQIGAYSPGGSWLFLKAVKVEWTGSEFVVVSVHNFDPDNTDNKRLFIATFAGAEIGLPTHLQIRDQSRIVYGVEEDDFFFGLSDRWVSLGGSAGYQANTVGFGIGDLVYTRSDGNLGLALATLGSSTADGAVTGLGVTGLVKTTGKVDSVKVELGSNVTVGRLVYLSKTEPGTITEQQSTPFSQFVGRCLEVVDSTSVNILFHRGEPLGTSGALLSTYLEDTLAAGGSWLGGGPYYQDVDISSIQFKNAVITVWDNSTEFEIQPSNIEFISDSVMRIWMPVNTQNLTVFAVGPSDLTISSSDVGIVTDTLAAGGSWLGGGPYYQDIDVSSLTGQSSVVLVRDIATNEKIMPAEIQYDSATNLRIWMPVNTKTLEVVVFGASASTATVALTTILPSGASWTADGPQYFQEIDISDFGGDDIALQFYDIDTDEVVFPASIEFPNPATIKVWMPVDTRQLNVTIIG